jgi:hypothetical protein
LGGVVIKEVERRAGPEGMFNQDWRDTGAPQRMMAVRLKFWTSASCQLFNDLVEVWKMDELRVED